VVHLSFGTSPNACRSRAGLKSTARSTAVTGSFVSVDVSLKVITVFLIVVSAFAQFD
jgi:hypothetical protein